MKRKYKDVNGEERVIELVELLPYLVKYHKDYPPSTARKWKLEDGSIVQIPDTVWSNFNIEYIDFDINIYA